MSNRGFDAIRRQITGDEIKWQKIEYTRVNPEKRSFVDDPTYLAHSPQSARVVFRTQSVGTRM